MGRDTSTPRGTGVTRRDGVAAAGLLCLILIAMSTSLVSSCQRPLAVEVVRVTSPDQMVDAVLVTRAVGATVSTPHELYIVPRGEGIAGEPSLRGDRFEGLTLVWNEPKYLEISYKKGRIFSFANFWQSERVQTFNYLVELRLKPATSGFSLN